MKNVKSFLAKNFLILAFAVGGVFVVTSNLTVSANEPVVPEIGDDKIKYCMEEGGSVVAWYRTCIDPGYHTLPKWKCGERLLITNGKGSAQCY